MKTIIPYFRLFILFSLIYLFPVILFCQTLEITPTSEFCEDDNIMFVLEGVGTCTTPPFTYRLQRFNPNVGMWVTEESLETSDIDITFNRSAEIGDEGMWRIEIQDSDNSICTSNTVTADTVDEKPIVSIVTPNSSPFNICQGSSLDLQANTSGATTSITWSDNGAGGNFTNPNGNVTSYTPPASFSNPITITVTTNTNGQCPAAQAQILVNINSIATVDIITNSTVICEESSIQLEGTFGGGAQSVTWSSVPAGSFSNPNSLTPTFTPPANVLGDITITLTTDDPTGPCPAVSESVVITVEEQPIVLITTPDSDPFDICQGSSLDLQASTGGATSSITWSDNGAGGSFTNPNGNITSYTHPANFPNPITILVTTNANGQCPAAEDEVEVNINPVATVDINTDPTSICEESSIQLEGTFGGGAQSITWSSVPAGSFSNPTSLTPTFTPPANVLGDITITLTTDDPTGPCPAVSESVVITVDEQPIVSIATPSSDPFDICQGSSLDLQASTGGATSSITWSDNGAGGSFTNPNGNVTSYTHPTNFPNQIAIAVTTNSNGQCPAAEDDVAVNINPAATVDINTDPTIICEESSIQLNSTFGGGAQSITWSSAPAGSFSDPNSSTPTFTPPDDVLGDITITLTTDDPIGPCPAASDEVIIEVDEQPTVDPTAAPAINCQGQSFTLGVATNSAVTSVMWTASPTSAGVFSNSNDPNTTFTPIASFIGNISICVESNSTTACAASIECIPIVVQSAPFIQISTPSNQITEICQGTSFDIETTGNSDVVWTVMSNGGGGSLSDITDPNPTFTADGPPGNVTVMVETVTNSVDCQEDTDFIIFEVLPSTSAQIELSGSSPASQCIDQASFVFNATLIGANSGSWSDNGAGGTFDPTSGPNTVYTPNGIGEFCVSYTTTDALCGNVESEPICVKVFEEVIASVSTLDDSLCMGLNFDIDADIMGPNNNGIWTSNVDNGVFSPDNTISATTYIPPLNYSGPITLTFTPNAEPQSPCIPQSADLVLQVNPLPTSTIAVEEISMTTSGDGIICQGEDVILTVVGSDDNTSCSWTSDFDLSPPNDCTWNLNNLDTFGVFNVDVTVVNEFMCSSSNNTTITISQDPDLEIIVQNPCVGEDLQLEFSSIFLDTYFTSFGWEKDNVFLTDMVTYTSENVGTAQSGTYTFTAVDPSGCNWSISEDITIDTIPQPVIQDTYATVCQNAQVYYILDNFSEDSNIEWNISPPIPAENFEIIDDIVLIIHWTESGFYEITVQEYLGDDPNTPCLGVYELEVEVTNDIAPDTAPIFHYPLNDILIVKDPDVTCYQWGYYDPVTRSMVTIPGETFQAFAATGDDIRAFNENRTYWVETWNDPTGECDDPSCSTISIRMEEGGGILPEEEENKFVVYPNPNRGVFTVETNQMPKPSYQLKVVDSFGRQVLDKEIFTDNNKIKETLSFEQDLSAGVYMLFIYDELDIYREAKFIVFN